MGDIVQSVDRALSILEILANNSDGMGIKEISEEVSLHKSTVHRLLATLIEKNYVRQNKENSKYILTFKMFELSNIMTENISIIEVVRPYLKEIAKETGEVAHFVIREENDIVYIDKIIPNNTIRMSSRIGKRIPMFCTAVGKSMMAYMSEDEIREVLVNSEANFNENEKSSIDFEEYIKEIDKVRELGFALDKEENEFGIMCIGTSILNHKSEVCGAISISGPSSRLDEEKIRVYAKLIKDVALKISKEIGYNKF